ncbi:MAG: CotH kinase family protein, partial [Clostridia bacterium]
PTPTPTPTQVPLPTPVKNSLIRVFIDTENGEEVVSKFQKVNATIVIDDGKSAPSVTLPRTAITLEGRGNSTFDEIPKQFPKYPLKFEFVDKQARSVCGMLPANHWNMLANLYDKTLLRNAVALNLGANLSGLQWTPKAQMIEVYLNGRYHGVFLLTEDVEAGPNRLNIDMTGDTPGFLVEWDMRAKTEADATYNALLDKTGKSPFDYYFVLPKLSSGITFTYKSPKGDKMTQVQRDYVKKTVSDISDLLVAPSNEAYLNRVNLNSFVDYFIVNDFFQNNDAVSFSSIYLFQDKGGKLNMGPIWDFDLYLGNNGGNSANKCLEWGSPWFSQLVTKSSAFKTALKSRWKVVKPIVQSSVLNYLDTLNTKIQDAQTRNFNLWKVINFTFSITKNRAPSGSYAGEVTFLKNWLTQRLAYADGYY